MVTVRRAALLLTLPLLLAGCGGGTASAPGPSAPASASTTAPASPAPSSGPAEAPEPGGSSSSASSPDAPPPADEDPEGGLPPFVSDGEPAQADAGGDLALGVAAVRAARHEGFDRVVVELAGRGDPGWFVQRVDAPTAAGSGDPLEVAGEAFLVLVVRGVGYPQDTGVPDYAGPRELVPADTAVVRELEVGGSYEGDWDASVGLAAERPYRVFSLDGPPRVVLDVAHEG
jgi:hypothetical protein